LRLGSYLWRRVAGHHPKEDVRYAVLREKWQANLQGAFLKFFLAQAVLVWLLMLPVLLIAGRTETAWHPLEVAGLILWAVALMGEGLADAQLARFKRENREPKAICQVGLWRYSRHPNYFFQSLLWWALFLMALPAVGGWWAILAPVAMLHFLLNVTGIPLTEKLSVEKRGEVYREYQRTTSAFVPWFPSNKS
jgi:steroid 5-alpha reductase family enzyme